MKKLKRNLLSLLSGRKIAGTGFAAFFIFHILFTHAVLSNYIICIENDGSLSLEGSSASELCCNASLETQNANTEIHLSEVEDCRFCTDVNIYENCDEQFSHQVKRLSPFIPHLLPVGTEAFEFRGAAKNDFMYKYPLDLLPIQLESNKTVILLI